MSSVVPAGLRPPGGEFPALSRRAIFGLSLPGQKVQVIQFHPWRKSSAFHRKSRGTTRDTLGSEFSRPCGTQASGRQVPGVVTPGYFRAVPAGTESSGDPVPSIAQIFNIPQEESRNHPRFLGERVQLSLRDSGLREASSRRCHAGLFSGCPCRDRKFRRSSSIHRADLQHSTGRVEEPPAIPWGVSSVVPAGLRPPGRRVPGVVTPGYFRAVPAGTGSSGDPIPSMAQIFSIPPEVSRNPNSRALRRLTARAIRRDLPIHAPCIIPEILQRRVFHMAVAEADVHSARQLLGDVKALRG